MGGGDIGKIRRAGVRMLRTRIVASRGVRRFVPPAVSRVVRTSRPYYAEWVKKGCVAVGGIGPCRYLFLLPHDDDDDDMNRFSLSPPLSPPMNNGLMNSG